MKALLVRVGVDQAYGGWNAPVDEAGHFVYALIGIYVVREVVPVASVPRGR